MRWGRGAGVVIILLAALCVIGNLRNYGKPGSVVHCTLSKHEYDLTNVLHHIFRFFLNIVNASCTIYTKSCVDYLAFSSKRIVLALLRHFRPLVYQQHLC